MKTFLFTFPNLKVRFVFNICLTVIHGELRAAESEIYCEIELKKFYTMGG